MKHYGLIGASLQHSFSKGYFTEKFQKKKIAAQYENYELADIGEIRNLFADDKLLVGVNITIPYKKAVIPYLDELDELAKRIGAVNTVKRMPDGRLKGFNTDYLGFRKDLRSFLRGVKVVSALVLGSGGASEAVVAALKDEGIFTVVVSRSNRNKYLLYEQIYDLIVYTFKLVVNTTPLGTWPNVDEMPSFPYEFLDKTNYLYDLIYNPEETAFLKQGKERKAKTRNGYGMLVAQAEASWDIWKS